MKPQFPNYGTAYYEWIRKQLAGCADILDVGCSDGSLISFISNEVRKAVGFDPDVASIDSARQKSPAGNCSFVCGRFEDFSSEELFDAVIFADSLHHMEMRSTLRKAVSLLRDGGKIIVVGLADPTTLKDHLFEGLRIINSRIASRGNHLSPEESDKPASDRYPEMGHVRRIVSEELPGARIRLGLHYRYLLTWQKKG